MASPALAARRDRSAVLRDGPSPAGRAVGPRPAAARGRPYEPEPAHVPPRRCRRRATIRRAASSCLVPFSTISAA